MVRIVCIVACVLAVAFAGVGALAQDGRSEAKSPFDAVEWAAAAGGAAPTVARVKVGESWYVLESINGKTMAELLAGIEREYGRDSVQKRFEEDLIEAMGKLGIAPGEKARLRVREAAGGDAKEIDAEWSREKRQNLMKAGAAGNATQPDAAVREQDVIAALDELEKLIEKRSAYAAASKGTPKGDAWRAKLKDARARAAQITTRSALMREAQKIVATIGDGHAAVEGVGGGKWAPFLVMSRDTAGGPLLAIRADRQVYLVDVTPVLVSIDDVPIEQWIAAAQETVPAGSPQMVRDRMCGELLAIERLRPLVAPGAVGRVVVTAGMTDFGGAVRRRKVVPLAAEKPVRVERLPAESRLLEMSLAAPTGYVRLAQMDSQGAESMLAKLKEFAAAGAKSVVVDVRGNGGGSRDALFALAGAILPEGAEPVVINASRPLLVDGKVPEDVAAELKKRGLKPAGDAAWSAAERAAIAKFKGGFVPEVKLADERFDGWWFACVGPATGKEAVRWTGKVVVLQDSACFSATDVFLAAMKELPGVTLVGEASGGGSGAAREFDLPAGLKLRLSSMVSFQPTGKLFDGNGVEPDVVIKREAADPLVTFEDRWLRIAAETANVDGK